MLSAASISNQPASTDGLDPVTSRIPVLALANMIAEVHQLIQYGKVQDQPKLYILVG